MINYYAQNKCKIICAKAINASTQSIKISKNEIKKECKRDKIIVLDNYVDVHSSKQGAPPPLLWKSAIPLSLTGRKETFTTSAISPSL